MKMRKFQQGELIVQKLKAKRVELSSVVSTNSKLGEMENVEALAVASFVFSLMEIIEKAEELAKEVEELGQLASFHQHLVTYNKLLVYRNMIRSAWFCDAA